jgi:hypothetical protein
MRVLEVFVGEEVILITKKKIPNHYYTTKGIDQRLEIYLIEIDPLGGISNRRIELRQTQAEVRKI